jgi:hypothetical protein
MGPISVRWRPRRLHRRGVADVEGAHVHGQAFGPAACGGRPACRHRGRSAPRWRRPGPARVPAPGRCRRTNPVTRATRPSSRKVCAVMHHGRGLQAGVLASQARACAASCRAAGRSSGSAPVRRRRAAPACRAGSAAATAACSGRCARTARGQQRARAVQVHEAGVGCAGAQLVAVAALERAAGHDHAARLGRGIGQLPGHRLQPAVAVGVGQRRCPRPCGPRSPAGAVRRLRRSARPGRRPAAGRRCSCRSR